jgi:hypothetical protein
MMEFVVKTLHHYATVFILPTVVGLEDYDGGEDKLEGKEKDSSNRAIWTLSEKGMTRRARRWRRVRREEGPTRMKRRARASHG